MFALFLPPNLGEITSETRSETRSVLHLAPHEVSLECAVDSVEQTGR